MPQQNREFELKLTLAEDECDRLMSDPFLPGVENKRSQTELRSTYYDTPDHRLHDEGMTLRVRQDGRGYVQTVKADTELKGGLSNPIEIESRVDRPEPDLDRIGDKRIRKRVRQAVKGSALMPVFETVVTRITQELRKRGSVMELALDKGETRAGGQQRPICEAELELIKGDPKDMLEAAQALFGKRNVLLSPMSKAERGYRLLLKTGDSEIKPVHAVPPQVERGQACGQAFAEILRDTQEQVVKNRTVVLETEEPEGVHQLRVGLTRLRTAQRALRPHIDSSSLSQLEADARELSQTVGRLRDADVFIEDIYAPVAGSCGGKSGFDQLYQCLRAHRAAKQEEARKALTSETWSRLLLSLTLWPPILLRDPALKEPVEDCAQKALQKRWKKVAKCGRSLGSLDPAERHKMRRSLKKLRYTVELFAPLYAKKDVKGFVKQLKALQDIFGYVNDVRTAEQLRDICAKEGDGPEAFEAVGYVLGYHCVKAAEVWDGVFDGWRQLKSTPRFWQ